MFCKILAILYMSQCADWTKNNLHENIFLCIWIYPLSLKWEMGDFSKLIKNTS